MENKIASLSLFAFGLVRDDGMAVVLSACTLVNGDIMTCPTALLALVPCESFLGSSGPPTPGVPCCQGMRKAGKYVASQATTTAIPRNLCECFRAAFAGIPVDHAKQKLIPQHCQVSLPLPLDPNIDCSKVPVL